MLRTSKSAFTLIEILVTLGIVAVLSTVVVVTLNPAELIKQARDSTRISDLNTINTALGTFAADVTSAFVGTSSIVYVSLPDSSPTCANLSLPALPGGWTYSCATTDNYKKTDGTGWIPANLSRISFGSPLEKLPIDPKNSTSTGLYYTFVTTGSWWELTAILESDKYGPRMVIDGGASPNAFEKGTMLTLTPTESLDRGIPPDLTAPSIATLSPVSVTAGDPGFTLTVDGTNFTSSSVINWGGSAKTTSFVSVTQLTAPILAGDISATGTIAVTVSDPVKGTSGSSNFAVSERIVFLAGAWTTDSSAGPAQSIGSAIAEVNGIIYVMAGGTAFSSYNPTSKNWTTLASTPSSSGRGAALVEYNNDTLYAFRGVNTTTFWKYTISTNTWTAMTSTASAVQDGGTLAYPGTGDYIYASRGNNSTDFLRYSVTENSWTMNGVAEGAGTSIAEVDAKMYLLVGGSTNFRRYDPATQSWTNLASTTAAVARGAALVKHDSNTIYAFRGTNTTNFWKYIISTNTWTSVASAPSTVDSGGSLVYPGIGDYIYASRGSNSSTFWRYSVSGDSWSVNGVAEGQGASITEVDGKMYIFAGGSTNFRRYDPATQNWTNLSSTTAAVAAGAALVKYNNDTIYAFRGSNTTAFWKYTISTDIWTSVTSTPSAVYRGGSLVYPGVGDYIYASRGESNLNFWRYSVEGDSWSSLNNLPFPILGGSSLAVVGTNTIYTTIGQDATNFAQYDISTGNWTSKAPVPGTITGISPLASDGTSVYALRGTATRNFYKYNPTANTWSTLASTTMDMGSTSYWEPRGGIVYSPSLSRFFAVSGNSPGALGSIVSYNPSTDSWSYPGYGRYPIPFTILGGSSLAVVGTNTIYITIGQDLTQFAQYDISTGNWTSKAPVPATVTGISPLASDGTSVYALRGTATRNFYKYNPTANTWSTLASSTVNMGDLSYWEPRGGIVYSPSLNKFFATSGVSPGNLGSVISYNPSNDSWSYPGYGRYSIPFQVLGGGSLVAFNSTTLYVTQGQASTQFAKYDTSTGDWTTRATAPAGISGILSLATDGTSVYSLRGETTNTFYKYNPTTNAWSTLATTTMNMGSNYYDTRGAIIYSQTHNSLFAIPGSGGYILKNTQ